MVASLGTLGGCSCEGETTLSRSEARLVLSPAALEFGSAWLGESRTLPLELRNEGDVALTIEGARVEGSDFERRGELPTRLLPGASATIEVRYLPTAAGEARGMLTVASTDPRGPQQVLLSGEGLFTSLRVGFDAPSCGTAGSADLGLSALGERVEETVSLENTGASTLRLRAVRLEAPSSTEWSLVQPPEVDAALAPGATLDVTVRFAPVNPGPESATLVIESDDPRRPDVRVPVCAAGAEGQLCARPDPLALGRVPLGRTASAALTLESCGPLPVSVVGVEFTDDALHPTDPGFALQDAPALPLSLGPGATAEVGVVFTALARGAARGFVQVTLADGRTKTVPVTAMVRDPELVSWTNLGGNGRANGFVDVIGPDAAGPAELLWEGGPESQIAWQPMIEGRRVFMVRQAGYPPDPPAGDAPIFALDLDTGAQLWTAELPYEPDDWITWIVGVKDGRLFATRSGDGIPRYSPLYCLDAATGEVLWHTAGDSPTPRHEVSGGPYQGAVFAPDGDVIMASCCWLERIDAETGAVVWRTPRRELSNNLSGPVTDGTAVYVVDSVADFPGMAVRKFDIATGAFLYRGPLLRGGLFFNSMYLGAEGRIYVPMTNDVYADEDFLYALTDTGTELVEDWHVPAGAWFARSAAGPDGSVYAFAWTGLRSAATSMTLRRLDPATGAVLAESGPLTGQRMQIHMAIDARGVLYVSNGTANHLNDGRLWSFDPDLTERWSIAIPGNLNQGGPVLGTDGTLVIASTGTQVRAYRTPRP